MVHLKSVILYFTTLPSKVVPMIIGITHITVVVDDCDKALDFYVNKLGFVKRDDHVMPEYGYRWLTVSPKDALYPQIVLHKPMEKPFEGCPDAQKERELIGKASMMVFQCDNCQATFDELVAKGVETCQEPTDRPWGIEASIKDLYGNSIGIFQEK